MTIAHRLYRLTADLPCRLITRNGAPYLERYYLGRLGPLTAYLHRFVSGDGDPEPHDHPWHAAALVLTGEYTELRCQLSGADGLACLTRPVRWINSIRKHDIHQIVRARPETWTLFVHGRIRKKWGFFKRIDDAALPGLLYYQPLRSVPTGWQHAAPLGRDSGREPFGRPA